MLNDNILDMLGKIKYAIKSNFTHFLVLFTVVARKLKIPFACGFHGIEQCYFRVFW